MDFPLALIERADPDTNTTIGTYLRPVTVAFLMVHLPLEDALVATFVYWLEASLAKGDSSRRACPGAFLALIAEFGDPKIDWLTHSEGQVGNHL